ncbi:hypothetical protein JMA_39640 (plasmid) [Jeotgalibacillus malaysiensis]|uniref:Uncharacterized protein n=1 Tax=Jeotgalibacillus malaysiensis TaxID=1508404 RepID=A0A0B5AX63_9BACL|nr:hypothetical protein JMA_39640 [Jeotgalibacillus malaysiensis]
MMFREAGKSVLGASGIFKNPYQWMMMFSTLVYIGGLVLIVKKPVGGSLHAWETMTIIGISSLALFFLAFFLLEKARDWNVEEHKQLKTVEQELTRMSEKEKEVRESLVNAENYIDELVTGSKKMEKGESRQFGSGISVIIKMKKGQKYAHVKDENHLFKGRKIP